jgi:tetratricopeptide (TPR) repeat protein
VRDEERWRVDLQHAHLAWVKGDAAAALAASDSVLAYQADSPSGLRARGAALALAGRWEDAFAAYEEAVRLRTGIVGLRCEVARDLTRAGRLEEARRQLDEARLLDAKDPTAEALRGWVALSAGDLETAGRHARQALEWGPWCDLARIVLGAAEQRAGAGAAAEEAWAPVEERIASGAPPEWTYRQDLASWETIHELPAVERELLREVKRR